MTSIEKEGVLTQQPFKIGGIKRKPIVSFTNHRINPRNISNLESEATKVLKWSLGHTVYDSHHNLKTLKKLPFLSYNTTF
jgi:hypothetical protein